MILKREPVMQSKVTIAMIVGVLCMMLAEVSTVRGELWVNPLFESSSAAATLSHGGFVRLADGSLMTVEGSATRTSKDNGKTWSESRAR